MTIGHRGRARAAGGDGKSRSAAPSNVSAIALGSAGARGAVRSRGGDDPVDAQVADERVFSNREDTDDEHEQRGHRRQRLRAAKPASVAFAADSPAPPINSRPSALLAVIGEPPGANGQDGCAGSASNSPAAPIAAPAKQSQRPARAPAIGPTGARFPPGSGAPPTRIGVLIQLRHMALPALTLRPPSSSSDAMEMAAV